MLFLRLINLIIILEAMWVKIKDRSELVEGDKYKMEGGEVWTIVHIFARTVRLVGFERNVAQIYIDDFIKNYSRWVENELEGTGLEGTIFDDSSKEKGFID